MPPDRCITTIYSAKYAVARLFNHVLVISVIETADTGISTQK